MNFKENKIIFILLIFISLIINIVVFYPSIFHIARSEQDSLFIETSDIHSFKQLIQYMYPYTRTRIIAPGDKITFRPLLYIFFSLEKWFFGYNFIYWQITAIILNLLVTWCLLRIFFQIKPHYFAILLALNFSIFHISQEMVIWQHMTPILLHFVLILSAFYNLMLFLNDGCKEKSKLWKIVLYLTIACFIHEFALICTVIFMSAIFLKKLNLRKSKTGENDKSLKSFEIIKIIILPIIIFVSWSFIDYILRVDSLDMKSRGLNILNIAFCFAKMFVISFVGPLFPCCLNISLQEMFSARMAAKSLALKDLFTNLFSNGTCSNLNLILAILGLTIVIAYILKFKGKKKSLKDIIKNEKDKFFDTDGLFIGFIGLILSLGYVFMISLIRLNYWGAWYLGINLFYLYPVILFNLIFIYSLFIRLSDYVEGKTKYLTLLILVFLSLSALLNGFKNYKLNADVKQYSDKVQNERKADLDSHYLSLKYTVLAMKYYSDDLHDIAEEYFKKALEINPYNVLALNKRGKFYLMKKKYDLAFKDFNDLLSIDPQHDDGYNNRGLVYQVHKKYDKAFSDFNKSISLNPENAEAYNNRGILYQLKGDYDLALKDFNKSLDINNNYADAYGNRGNIYQMKKQYDLAISDYTKSIEIKPDNYPIYVNRSFAYKAKKDYEKALKDALKVKELGHVVDKKYVEELKKNIKKK